LGGERVQHRVQDGVERPSCPTCHVRSLSYTPPARRLRRAPRGPAKSGANPALSRNCEAPPEPGGDEPGRLPPWPQAQSSEEGRVVPRIPTGLASSDREEDA
jgi:hypothetical protein